jgi:hypothetical protein
MRLSPLILMLVLTLLGGCSGHFADTFDCAAGIGRGDCAPGSAGYKERAEQEAAANSVAAMDDVKCRSYGATPESQAYRELPPQVGCKSIMPCMAQNGCAGRRLPSQLSGVKQQRFKSDRAAVMTHIGHRPLYI